MIIRQSSIELIYHGVNITDNIKNDLKSISYTDNASGAADDISIELKDDIGKWINYWNPKKGDIINPFIKTKNWRSEGDAQLFDCGIFLVDEVSYSGRPRTLSIGAVSTPKNNDFTNTPKSKTWDNASVKKIAQSIAYNAGLALYFDSSINPIIKFIEQSEESDIEFINKICKNNGLAIKVYSNKMIIFNEYEYEQKKEVATIKESDMLSWQAKTTYTDTGYDACKVEYTDPTSGQELVYMYTIPNRVPIKVYKVNENVSSISEAKILAKATLREKNKNETTLSISLMGNLNLVATQTIIISDLGVFNGKYYIDKISHTLGSGFTTDLDMHKVLEGGY